MNKFLKIKPNLLEKETPKNTTNINDKLKPFVNKTIVFTGFRDKDAEIKLENIGSKITTSVSKNTDYVIASDPNEESSKIKKAKDFKIKILSKDEFYKIINK